MGAGREQGGDRAGEEGFQKATAMKVSILALSHIVGIQKGK